MLVPTVREAFEAFLPNPRRKPVTINKYRLKLKPFLARYGQQPITMITGDLLYAWFNELGERYAEATLGIHRSCHLAFYNYCIKQGWLETNPAKELPRYSHRPKRIICAKDTEVDQVLSFCEQDNDEALCHRRDAAIFVLGSVGMRRSNIAAVRYSEAAYCLDNPMTHQGQQLYMLVSAGKEDMEAVLDERRAALLRRYVDHRPVTGHDALFVVLNSEHWRYLKPLSIEGFTRARRRVCERAGVQPAITFQEMRRLLGTKVAREHGLETAAHVLGHRSGTRTVREHYYDPDKEAARIAAFEAHLRTYK